MKASPTTAEYVDTGIRNMEFVDHLVGELIMQVVKIGGGTILGAMAANEAKDAVVEVLTKTFSKQKETTPDLSAIETDEFDDTPNKQQLFALEDKQDEQDIATTSVTYRRAKYEALASSNGTTTKVTDADAKNKTKTTDDNTKSITMEEMLQEQRVEYQRFIKELLKEQQAKSQEELRLRAENWRKQNLDNETTMRRQQTEIDELKHQAKDKDDRETQDPLFNNWPGKSLGPEVMQGRAEPPPKHTPVTARMETPAKEWKDILEDTVQDWANHASKSGNPAPDEMLVQGRIVHNFKDLVEQRLDYQETNRSRFKYIRKGNKDNPPQTRKRNIIRPAYSPGQSSSDGSSPGRSDGGAINNLALGRDDGDQGGSGEPPDDDELHTANHYTGGSNNDRQDREFQLVNARNINIVPFSGKNVQTNPYLPFNNALRRLILVQGKDGEELLDILDEVEQCGDDKFTKEDLKDIANRCPKIYQYDRAVKLALLNYITGTAHGRVKYGVEGGLDAWRELYNRYVPLPFLPFPLPPFQSPLSAATSPLCSLSHSGHSLLGCPCWPQCQHCPYPFPLPLSFFPPLTASRSLCSWSALLLSGLVGVSLFLLWLAATVAYVCG